MGPGGPGGQGGPDANSPIQQAVNDVNKAIVSADAKPDVNMNRESMAKYRPEMVKFYLNKSPRFQ